MLDISIYFFHNCCWSPLTCLCQVYNCIRAALTLEPQVILNTFTNIFCKCFVSFLRFIRFAAGLNFQDCYWQMLKNVT